MQLPADLLQFTTDIAVTNVGFNQSMAGAPGIGRRLRVWGCAFGGVQVGMAVNVWAVRWLFTAGGANFLAMQGDQVRSYQYAFPSGLRAPENSGISCGGNTNIAGPIFCSASLYYTVEEI